MVAWRGQWIQIFSLLMAGAALFFTQPASAAGARQYQSGPIQITADGQTVWFVNPDNDSVGRLNTASLAVDEFVLPNGGMRHSPYALAVKDDGSEVWVASRDSDRVYVLNGVSGAVKNTIQLPWGTGAYGIVISRPNAGEQSHALITGLRSGDLLVIDAVSKSLVNSVKIGASPATMVLANDESLWVTGLFADGEHPRITRVDVANPAAPFVTTFQRVGAVQPQNNSSTAPRLAEGGYITLRGHPAQVPAGQDQGRIWLNLSSLSMAT